MYIVRL